MAGEVIEFVDSVSASATVRLSLTTSPWRVIFEGTSVPPPPLRRSVAQTLLADGGYIPASAYDNRVITLRLQYRGTAGPASATAVQALNRELDRESNILRWQPDSTLPAVYFRTFRSPDYDPQTDHALDLYQMTVQIVAEPFAVGLMVTVTQVVVSNDPAAAQGMFFDVTSVQGDVETPLLIKVPGASVTNRQSLFAVRRRGTPSAMPFLLQAEAMTLGTDTTIITGGSDWSPSATNSDTTDTSFSTVSTIATRLSTATFPASPSVDARGLYRVFARVGANTSAANFDFTLRHGIRLIDNTATRFLSTATGIQTHVDLGLVQIPEGFDPVTDGPTGVAVAAVGIPLALRTARINGSNQYTDYLLFVPADDCLAIVKWGSSSPTSFVFNGITRSVYGLDNSGRFTDIQSAGFVGGPIMVSPGVTNRVIFINDVNPTPATNDGLTKTIDLSPFYWPRYLSVRPTST
jgi:hypothetical protein